MVEYEKNFLSVSVISYSVYISVSCTHTTLSSIKQAVIEVHCVHVYTLLCTCILRSICIYTYATSLARIPPIFPKEGRLMPYFSRASFIALISSSVEQDGSTSVQIQCTHTCTCTCITMLRCRKSQTSSIALITSIIHVYIYIYIYMCIYTSESCCSQQILNEWSLTQLVEVQTVCVCVQCGCHTINNICIYTHHMHIYTPCIYIVYTNILT